MQWAATKRVAVSLSSSCCFTWSLPHTSQVSIASRRAKFVIGRKYHKHRANDMGKLISFFKHHSRHQLLDSRSQNIARGCLNDIHKINFYLLWSWRHHAIIFWLRRWMNFCVSFHSISVLCDIVLVLPNSIFRHSRHSAQAPNNRKTEAAVPKQQWNIGIQSNNFYQ